MRVPIAAASVIAMAVVLSACGGGGTTGSGPSADPGSEPTAAAVTTAPEPTVAATDDVAPTAGDGSGSGTAFAARPCEVVTQGDAEAALGVSGLTSQVLPVDPNSGICSWRDAANTVEVYAGVWDSGAGLGQWEAIAYLADNGGEGIERIDGLGGDALFATQGAVLLVWKNSTLVQLTVRHPDFDEAAQRAAVIELGRAALGRL